MENRGYDENIQLVNQIFINFKYKNNMKENLFKLIGAIYYICYFIFCLMDESPLTPKECIWGMQEWEDGYYPIIIIEYLIFFPLWMWIWNNIISPVLASFFSKN